MGHKRVTATPRCAAISVVSPPERQDPLTDAGQQVTRVLVYGMNHAPELVGIGRYTADIVSEFVARGREVTVITAPPHYPYWSTKAWRGQGVRNRYSQELLAGAHIWRCPLILPKHMHGAWRVLAPLSFAITSGPIVFWRILRERPELVVCVEPTLLAAPAAILAGRLTGARLALHVQDLEPEAAFASGSTGHNLAPLIRWFRRGFDCIITLSHAMGSALAAGGVSAAKINVWPNWSDIGRIARGRDPVQEAAWRRQLDLADGQRVALYSGTINRKHAPLLLVDVARLLEHRKDIVIVLAGDGPQAAQIAEAAVESPNLRLLPLQPEERLPALLHFADVHLMPQDAALDDLMLPSRIGGMLASGKPMIITANPKSVLADFLARAAILCPCNDAHAVAAALSAVLADDSDVRTAAKARRNRWRMALKLDRRRCLPGLVNTLEDVTPARTLPNAGDS